MNRTKVIVAGAIAVLAALGIGQLYEPREVPEIAAVPPPPAEVKPIPVDEVVSTLMTSLEHGSEERRAVALTALLDELESPAYAKARLSTEVAAPLAQAVIAVVTASTATQTPEQATLRLRAAGLIAGRTRGDAAKQFALQALVDGPADLRAQVARHVGLPHGVRGKDVFEAVQHAGEKGLIPGAILSGALQRLGGKKAVDSIVALINSSDDWRTIRGGVVALQEYHDAALLHPALERLEQTGLLQDAQKLPWINAKLFAAYMESAEGAALSRGLRAAKTRPSLVRSCLEAATRGLEAPDPVVRRDAAEAVRKAVLAKAVDAARGEALLAGRLDRETEPVLKAELTGGLEQVRGLLPAQAETRQ